MSSDSESPLAISSPPEVPWDADGLEGLPPETPQARPPWAPKRLSGRHLIMCEYHLAGYTNREIAENLGMHEVTVGLVLRSPPAQDWLLARVGDLDAEFHGQFRKVVRNMGQALDHESTDVKLKASEMWLKAHGKFNPKSKEERTLTAEDVIQTLLSSAKTVQFNIDNRRLTPDSYSALLEGSE